MFSTHPPTSYLLPPLQSKIEETINTLKLENEMTMRQVKGAVADKEKALVDHDVMKLEVKRLRDILALHADEVFSLENRKFQLKMSMEERKHEIEVHRWVWLTSRG